MTCSRLSTRDTIRAGASPARTLHETRHHPYRVRAGLAPALVNCVARTRYIASLHFVGEMLALFLVVVDLNDLF
jgi:hypothetical protein